MMGVDDEAIDADFQEMVHRISDNGTSSDLKKRLRASVCQRPKPGS
jgi:hypothetical protein